MIGLKMMKTAIAAAVFGVLAVAGSAQAVTTYGLTTDNGLFAFDSTTPNVIVSGNVVTGLQTNEILHSIDFRPATGELFALGSSSRLYTINTTTYAATAIGAGPFSPALNGTSFDADFNPTVDRIRLVSDSDQNLRLNPITGGVAAVDGTLSYAAPYTFLNPNVSAAAYTNNFAGATSTTLYTLDTATDTLNIQTVAAGGPTDGQQTIVGFLGFDATDVTGFDIYTVGGQNFALASLNTTTTATSLLYSINLTTGQALPIGNFGGGKLVRDIAVVVPEPATLTLAGMAVLGLAARRRRA